MQPTLPRRGHMRLTLSHQPRQPRHLIQPAQHMPVPIHETLNLIFDPRLVGEFPHERLQTTQVVSRYAREQVVHGLELEAAVHEVQPGGTGDVHGRAELAHGEGFRGAEVGRAGAPVRERDLDVER